MTVLTVSEGRYLYLLLTLLLLYGLRDRKSPVVLSSYNLCFLISSHPNPVPLTASSTYLNHHVLGHPISLFALNLSYNALSGILVVSIPFVWINDCNYKHSDFINTFLISSSSVRDNIRY
jgi:hypothetical protein